jgi:tetratricopeptide (TPR) repeat protein
LNAVENAVGSVQQALGNAAALLSQRPGLALAQAEEILKVAPDLPQAQLLSITALRLLNRMDEALQRLGALSEPVRSSASAQLEKGLALGALGRGDEALMALRRATQLAPSMAAAWGALAQHLHASGDETGADHAQARYLNAATRDPELLAAASALAANRIPEAESRLRARLRNSPQDTAALRMLAEVAARIGKYEDARVLLQYCLELAPGFDAARANCATVLHRANCPEEALRQIDIVLGRQRGDAAMRNLKAAVLCRVGGYDEAIALYDGLLLEYPTQPRLWLSCGHALKTAGHTERAIAAYRRCVELDPSFGEAWWSLANLKTFRFTANDIATMQREALRDGIDPEQRCQFEFALGKAFEDAKRVESAFDHYARGNAQRRSQVAYSADECTARLRRSQVVFTRQMFEERAGVGCQAPDPIFIVGMPRAGSTLLEQILSSHSQVEGTMELPEVIGITRELKQRAEREGLSSYHELAPRLSPDEWRELGEEYLERTRIQRKTGAPFFIDKMPNNFQHIGLIHLMLPNAKIIDARRHPLACCFSVFKQYFARGQSFSYDQTELGRYYRDYVELMAHYDAVLPGRVHRVFYERMVEDTDTEVRHLLDHCGLPFEEGCLRFFENRRAVRTASSEQVRQPIYRDGVEYWRDFAPWLDPMAKALGEVLSLYPEVPDFDPDRVA